MGAVVVYAELLMLAGCQGNSEVLARFPDILDILESIKRGKEMVRFWGGFGDQKTWRARIDV